MGDGRERAGETGAAPAATADSDVSPPRGSQAVDEAVRRVFAPHLTSAAGLGLWHAWRRTLLELRPLGGVSRGNRIEVLSDGSRVFEAMWEAIDGARREVLMTTYILEPDAVGLRTLAALEAAARRGCRVVFVYDSVGSFRLAEKRLAPLREAGVRAVAYNPFLAWHSRISRLERNHRKILVVDGELGFCGGMNVGEEYAGEPLGTGYFRDTHLRLRGPCVAELGRLVRNVLEEKEEPPAPLGAGPDTGEGSLVQILESNVRRQRRAIQKAMRTTLRRSVARCCFTTPYFVPPGGLMRALEQAAGRGIEVRVLTTERSDVPIVRWAGQHLYGRLLKAGVRIFEFQGQVLHAKTMAVDGVYAAVGSFNLDHWSDRRNLEVNVSILDSDTARQIEQGFERDLEVAREVRLDQWRSRGPLKRVLQWIAYQLTRL